METSLLQRFFISNFPSGKALGLGTLLSME